MNNQLTYIRNIYITLLPGVLWFYTLTKTPFTLIIYLFAIAIALHFTIPTLLFKLNLKSAV